MLKKLGANKKGFTLVEVIVVLVILAIMAAILIPGMTGWIDKAQDKSAIVEARTVLLAIQTIASENYAAGNTLALTEATEAEILELAGVSGNIQSEGFEVNSSGIVTKFGYVTSGGETVTYVSGADEPFVVVG